jgi:hypothetical protein
MHHIILTKITLGNIFRSLGVVLTQSPNMNIMVVFMFIECWDCGILFFSCSSYVHGVWFHCKICNLWSVACCHMYCCCGCTSAWFCEASVRTSYCWWDIIFFLSSQGIGRFVFNNVHAIFFLKNVSLIVCNEVKLILASSSIMITLILDK